MSCSMYVKVASNRLFLQFDHRLDIVRLQPSLTGNLQVWLVLVHTRPLAASLLASEARSLPVTTFSRQFLHPSYITTCCDSCRLMSRSLPPIHE